MEKNSTAGLISSITLHIEKDGQVKKTKTEIDEKAAKIIKLIKARNQRKKGGGNVPMSEIIGNFEDFHKQYLSLYELHDDLIEDLRDKIRIREDCDEVEEEGSFITYNAADSFFSADEISIGSSPGHDHIRRGSDDFLFKPETPSKEMVDLRNKVVSITEEKEALTSQFTSKIQESEKVIEVLKIEAGASLSKIQESEKVIEVLTIEAGASLSKIQESEKIREALKTEAEEIESGKQKLFDEISELKGKCSESEKKLVSLSEEHENLMKEISSLKLEGENLGSEKINLQVQIEGKVTEAEQLGDENKKMQARIEELEKVFEEKEDQVSSLMKKLDENQNDSVSKIDKINLELQALQEVKESFERQVKDLERKVDFMISEKIQVEMQMEKKVKEAEQLKTDNEELQDRISQLEQAETKRGDELSAIQSVLEGMENDSSVKIKSSEEEVEKLQAKMKLNLKIIERKIEDTAEGFYKKIEDNIRILSRRIRVAEQLHMENKDIYMKTKEKYEKEHEDYKDIIGTTEDAIKAMKDISCTASVILDKSDTAAIKFNEQTENFLNRISKASCEVLFARDWVKRKNNALKNFQEDADCLLLEMGKKESEILGLRERVWKAENKARELEKIVKEKDDGMLSVGEEKREAIRQLCVWIEYHRSRSDSLKKILSDITAARRQRIA